MGRPKKVQAEMSQTLAAEPYRTPEIELKDCKRDYMSFRFITAERERFYELYNVVKMGKFAEGYIFVTSNNEVFMIYKYSGNVIHWTFTYGQEPLQSYDFYNPF